MLSPAFKNVFAMALTVSCVTTTPSAGRVQEVSALKLNKHKKNLFSTFISMMKIKKDAATPTRAEAYWNLFSAYAEGTQEQQRGSREFQCDLAVIPLDHIVDKVKDVNHTDNPSEVLPIPFISKKEIERQLHRERKNEEQKVQLFIQFSSELNCLGNLLEALSKDAEQKPKEVTAESLVEIARSKYDTLVKKYESGIRKYENEEPFGSTERSYTRKLVTDMISLVDSFLQSLEAWKHDYENAAIRIQRARIQRINAINAEIATEETNLERAILALESIIFHKNENDSVLNNDQLKTVKTSFQSIGGLKGELEELTRGHDNIDKSLVRKQYFGETKQEYEDFSGPVGNALEHFMRTGVDVKMLNGIQQIIEILNDLVKEEDESSTGTWC